MAILPRSFSLAVFRAHIENGLSVALGVGLTGLLVGWGLGFHAAVAAGSAALCVSISDRTDPLRQKLWIMGAAFACTWAFTALSAFAHFYTPAFIAAVAFVGLWAGLISAYGRWVLSLAMTCVLAFVLTMGQHFTSPATAAEHLMLSVLGGLIYTVYALLVAWLLDDRVRRLLLAEAMRAFADYLRAKAALYNPDTEGPGALRAVIDTHAALADKLQAARDSLFARRSHRMQLKRIDTLIALLDAFETVLSSDADIEALRHAAQRELMWRLNAFVYQMADEVERLTLALRSRHGHAAPLNHAEESRQLTLAVAQAREAAPGDPALHAFVATSNKLVLADTYIAALATALDDRTEPSAVAAGLDLELFRQDAPRGIGLLLNQFRWHAPALRYAIRLSLAMTTGLALTLVFPRFAHANWVLLTIALIMRANYSVTRQRRWDRVAGTLIGCALAVTFINTLPAPVLLLFIVLAVGTSHAYGLVAYRVTAIGASISSLLLLHFVDPLTHPQFFERIVDTLIGAGLSWAFSYLLPNWERDDLPRTVRGLLAADATFADAALRRGPVTQRYRLARKKALDAVAQLSGAIRRLADEPNMNRRALASLGELLGANYLLASDLSSMPVLVKLRAKELDPAGADAAIALVRERVVYLLQPNTAHDGHDIAAAARTSFAELHGSAAMEVLARRLDHIEHAARKVARLAARPVIEDL
ncbi:MAG: putative rane protein YccC [Alphaproteobacteria bacterium]|nr:putative rane protein YccC [Alphaproteobacteria bacterium]MDB5741367.1 putative rane protein YccC [Alphaproteobacteria bacterium]